MPIAARIAQLDNTAILPMATCVEMPLVIGISRDVRAVTALMALSWRLVA